VLPSTLLCDFRPLPFPFYRKRFQKICKLQVRWLPPVKEDLDNIRRKKGEPQDATYIGRIDSFGGGDFRNRGRGGFLYNVAFHLLLARVYDDKDVQEWIIRRSKLDWVIVRPVILTAGPKTNAYRALVDPRDWTCGFISRADVADFLVKQIDDGAFLHKTPVLTS
jgi:NAD(P)H-binding